MNHIELVSCTALALRQRIAAGSLSCTELAEAMIAHTEAVNPSLNAVVRFDAEFVRHQARAAERRRVQGDRSPWLGIPITVKDNIWVGGRRVSTGSTMFRDFVAPTDAIAVARLRQAGAVVLGSTNCSEFACRGVTVNPLHGATHNPWDLKRTPGGSSGGAAAATAAGIGCIALGTDAGGSVRRPAAHTGLVGLKPSAGLVPHVGGFDEPVYGHSQIGTLARCVADVADTIALIGAPDPADPQCPSSPFFDRSRAERSMLPSARIAYSPRLGLGFAVDPEIAASVRAMVQRRARAGHRVEEVDPIFQQRT
jgi:aspartyl-tRNA(Asn)/glutamyl-tRNA(Gln) amidotransferase subunit A